MLVKRDWVAIYNADVTPMKERLKKYISRKILNGHVVLRKYWPSQWRICQRSPSCHRTFPSILHMFNVFLKWLNMTQVVDLECSS